MQGIVSRPPLIDSYSNEIHLIDITYQFDIDPRYFIESYDEEIQLVLWIKQIIKEKISIIFWSSPPISCLL